MKTHNDIQIPLSVNRHEVCDILRATTHLFLDFETESKDPTVSEDRRKIAAGSAKYWRDFLDRIKVQLDAFDTAKSPDHSD